MYDICLLTSNVAMWESEFSPSFVFHVSDLYLRYQYPQYFLYYWSSLILTLNVLILIIVYQFFLGCSNMKTWNFVSGTYIIHLSIYLSSIYFSFLLKMLIINQYLHSFSYFYFAQKHIITIYIVLCNFFLKKPLFPVLNCV